MFVWPHKLILKTCGTTTLLLGLPTLLRIASETCGFNGVWRCFYSRKTFMFPDRQKGPHKDWAQEMEFLDQLFGAFDARRFFSFLRAKELTAGFYVGNDADNSSAYTVGRMNGDHWLLYLTPPRSDVLHPHALASTQLIAPQQPSNALSDLSATLSSTNLSSLASTSPSAHSHFLHRPRPHHPSIASRPDQTLEMLMTRLHPDACASFHHPTTPSAAYTSPLVSSDPHNTDAHALGASLSATLGLDALLPDATTDSFLFSPCGFSSNSLLGDRYATIHVTPEVDYSYASFETNFVPPSGGGLAKLVEDVLKVFRPAKLSITLFVSQEDDDDASEAVAGEEGVVVGRKRGGLKELLNPDLLERYARVDRIVYEFDGYSLVYAVFEEKVVGEEQQ